MSAENEGDLLRRARNLEHEALVEIYDLYSSSIFAYAYRVLGDGNLAEDCVSETFLRLLKSLKNQSGPQEHLKSYLYRIAHNWITDLYRKSSIRELELTDTTLPLNDYRLENHVENNMDLSEIQKAITSLTPDQRFVITLRYGEGWDINQIATALQKPVGAVKALQHRALAALQKIMGANEVSNGL